MLAREFLRLCALEALRPSALLDVGGPAWPTLAGQFVADSRIDPIEDVAPDERRPLIGVFTETTQLAKIAQASPFYKVEVDLVFELSVVGKFPVDGGEPIIDYADTDATIEAMLGALEDQVFRCLHDGPSGALFRKIAKLPFDEWVSTPYRSGEEAIKLARRTVRGRVCLRETCTASVLPNAEGLDRLPPVLRGIAEQLSGSTFLADLALGMARSATVPPALSPFNGVTMTVAPPSPAVDPITVETNLGDA